MRRLLLAVLAFLLTRPLCASSPTDAVALLFKQTASGGMEMQCTATAFERSGKHTRFLTAAHCVLKSDEGGRLIPTRDPLFLSFDAVDQKDYVRAAIEMIGRPDEGYDFAVLMAKLKDEIPVIALGDEATEEVGSPVINVAAPMGLGKVHLAGAIALLRIDRPIVDAAQHINWTGCILVAVIAEGGSSGSAITSGKTGKIIGIIVGGTQKLAIAVPVSRITNPDEKNLLYRRKAS